MANLNKVILTGTVARDFEKKTDKLGVFSICQNIWNGSEEKPHFFAIALIGEKNCSTAEKIVKKGNQITVEGSLENHSYEKDGKTISTLQIKAFSIYLNKFSNKNQNQEEAPSDEVLDEEVNWDEIQF
ncbi:MAG: single-stranded DNA-binding protein [Methanobrevibacter sp.]|nr:single-stranded DNA-binding protein [Methanobrevibacter sp.]